MRTLLIDNYDSFTYNLVHQITAATGREPVVVANDDPTWRPGRLAEFDAVVISPGPGTPERPADVGICRAVVETCELPLLGVCLGHQGIAAWHGGAVGRAPEPRHGRTSPVLHDGTGLFEGIPSPFDVVRYHSLTVTKLSDDLEPLAHTPDGVLMALRHRTRPLWGLQFHPESICTRHGDRLLRNFAGLARARAPRREPVRLTGAARLTETVQEGGAPRAAAERPPYDLLVERVPTRWEGEAAFDALFRAGPYAFWLDSSRPGAGPEGGRFSIMGDAGGPLARVATADAWTGTVTVGRGVPGSRAAEGETVTGDFLDWLDADLRSIRMSVPPAPERPFDFALGWVGYLGYELKAQCGGARAHRSADPDAVMVFADRAVVLDHVTGMTYLLALAERGRHAGARRWLGETAGRLTGPPPDRLPEPSGPLPTGPIRLRHDRDRYLELIAVAQEEIAAGETYEVCLTNMAEAETFPEAGPLPADGGAPGAPDAGAGGPGGLGPVAPARTGPGASAGGAVGEGDWRAYRLLRRAAPAPFGALLRFGTMSVLSTSPERFLRVAADGRVESRPIKGTRPRGATPDADARLRRELAASEKDRSENLMIVDLVRNDLGRCARPGSVEATGLFQVETYGTVHQLVSTVRARLRPDASAVDCVRAAFPGGSMTGAPKVRTMRIIDRLEGGPRGVYSGAIGYFSPTGTADLSIVIRTAVLTPGRIRYGTGGAVVALSDPAAEFEETAVKAAPLLALTGADFPGPATTPHPAADRVTPEAPAPDRVTAEASGTAPEAPGPEPEAPGPATEAPVTAPEAARSAADSGASA